MKLINQMRVGYLSAYDRSGHLYPQHCDSQHFGTQRPDTSRVVHVGCLQCAQRPSLAASMRSRVYPDPTVAEFAPQWASSLLQIGFLE